MSQRRRGVEARGASPAGMAIGPLSVVSGWHGREQEWTPSAKWLPQGSLLHTVSKVESGHTATAPLHCATSRMAKRRGLLAGALQINNTAASSRNQDIPAAGLTA